MVPLFNALPVIDITVFPAPDRWQQQLPGLKVQETLEILAEIFNKTRSPFRLSFSTPNIEGRRCNCDRNWHRVPVLTT